MRKQERTVYEMRLRLIDERLERMENAPAPTAPSVNNWLTAIVSTSPESLDAVLYSVAGMVIGLPASAASTALGGDAASAMQVWGTIAAAGVGLGIVRLSVGAVDLTGALEMLADKVIAYKEQRSQEEVPQSVNVRDLPIHYNGGTTTTEMPELSQFEHNTRTIPSCNTKGGERTIETDKLCAYLKYVTNIGERRKDYRPDYIKQKEWPDVRDYFIAKGWWNLTPNSPALPPACTQMRGPVMIANVTTRTNERTR